MHMKDSINPQNVEAFYEEAIRALIFADAEALDSLLVSVDDTMQAPAAVAGAACEAWQRCRTKRQILAQLLLKTRTNLSLLERIAADPSEYGESRSTWAAVSGQGGVDGRQEDSWPR